MSTLACWSLFKSLDLNPINFLMLKGSIEWTDKGNWIGYELPCKGMLHWEWVWNYEDVSPIRACEGTTSQVARWRRRSQPPHPPPALLPPPPPTPIPSWLMVTSYNSDIRYIDYNPIGVLTLRLRLIQPKLCRFLVVHDLDEHIHG